MGGEYDQSTLYGCVRVSWWNPLLHTINMH
jgi:hypothetical protein